MAKEVKKSVLSKIMGQVKKAHAEHKDDDFVFDARLPGGIKGGVAKLKSIGFSLGKKGAKNEGKPVFEAVGVVISPESHDGVKIKGLQTRQYVTLEATDKNPMEKIWPRVLKSIVGCCEVDPADYDEPDDLETALVEYAENLNENPVYFRFATRETPESKNPDGSVKWEARVWEDWNGVISDFDEETVSGSEEEDDTGSTEYGDPDEFNEEEDAEPTSPTKVKEPEEEPDLEELGRISDDEDESDKDRAKAQNVIEARAKAVGIKPVTIKKADSWSDVAALVAEKEAELNEGDEEPEEPEEEPEEEAEEPESVTPAKGDIYLYRPEGLKKDVQVEVTLVNEAKETCTLKNVKTGTLYKGKPWSELKMQE